MKKKKKAAREESGCWNHPGNCQTTCNVWTSSSAQRKQPKEAQTDQAANQRPRLRPSSWPVTHASQGKRGLAEVITLRGRSKALHPANTSSACQNAGPRASAQPTGSEPWEWRSETLFLPSSPLLYTHVRSSQGLRGLGTRRDGMRREYHTLHERWELQWHSAHYSIKSQDLSPTDGFCGNDGIYSTTFLSKSDSEPKVNF